MTKRKKWKGPRFDKTAKGLKEDISSGVRAMEKEHKRAAKSQEDMWKKAGKSMEVEW